jgi:hypothetical protein
MNAWFTAGFMVGLMLFVVYCLNHIFNRYVSKNVHMKREGR